MHTIIFADGALNKQKHICPATFFKMQGATNGAKVVFRRDQGPTRESNSDKSTAYKGHLGVKTVRGKGAILTHLARKSRYFDASGEGKPLF